MYKTSAVIEIKDEAQDSEMALPTSLTVFNRSMINLENEVSILSSYSLHSQVVKKLKSNVKYYSKGSVKESQLSLDEWLDNGHIFDLLKDTNSIDTFFDTKYHLKMINLQSALLKLII